MPHSAAFAVRSMGRFGTAILRDFGWGLLVLAALVLSSGCEAPSGSKGKSKGSAPAPLPPPPPPPPSPSAPSLAVALTRSTGTPYNVVVTATLHAAGGAPAPGMIVSISATGGTVGTVTDNLDGTYSATVAPAVGPSGEMPITVQTTVSGETLEQERTALILPTVDADWGVPEAVRGMVNSPGYEDGPNISPDGQWLIVTDVSPVDAFCCIVGCGGEPINQRAASSSCQTVIAPYDAPTRPDLPGAWRVVSPTQVSNKCPKACFTSNFTATGGENFDLPIPPIGSYIFKRQADGSFAEPQITGVDADGCIPPTGISFAGPPSGTSAAVIFDFNSPNADSAYSQIFWSEVTLGDPNLFASCSCDEPPDVTYNNLTVAPVLLTYNQTRSNPSFRGGMLWWDDEDVDPLPIYFSRANSSPLPATTFTPGGTSFTPIPVGTSGDDHSQPFFHAAANTLYFRSGDVGFSAATLVEGGDPAEAADWSVETVIMEGEGGDATGAIIAVGQPTIGTPPGGTDEIYFVYAIKTATGMNFNIGVIPKL